MKAEIFSPGVLHLPRWEVSIPIAREGKTQWLPIRLACVALGLDPQTQFTAIHRRFAKTVRQAPFRTPAGMRDYLALPAEDFALWLAGVNPARCKLATRAGLEAFIEEARAALSALLFRPGYVPADPDAGARVVRASWQQEVIFACDCGRHWRILTRDGDHAYEVERLNGDEE